MPCQDFVALPTSPEVDREDVSNQVVSQARVRLGQHDHFRSHCDSIDIDCREGRLVLMGRVPSFYLKQVLQTVLRGLPGVKQIDNRVDVISATGLSSANSRIQRKRQA